MKSANGSPRNFRKIRERFQPFRELKAAAVQWRHSEGGFPRQGYVAAESVGFRVSAVVAARVVALQDFALLIDEQAIDV
jgi:hypothetical protein